MYLCHLLVRAGAPSICGPTVFVVALWSRNASLVCSVLLFRESCRMSRCLDRRPNHGHASLHELLVVSFIGSPRKSFLVSVLLIHFFILEALAFYSLATFWQQRFYFIPLSSSIIFCRFPITFGVWHTFSSTMRLGTSALQVSVVVSRSVSKTEIP